MFVRGEEYRRKQLHKKYGGQQQGGISTPKGQPFIFIFTAAGRADTFNRTKAFAIADALKDRRPPPSVGTSPPSSPDLADGN